MFYPHIYFLPIPFHKEFLMLLNIQLLLKSMNLEHQ